MGGQDLGFLPGTEAEKMSPWAGAVTLHGSSTELPCTVETLFSGTEKMEKKRLLTREGVCSAIERGIIKIK